MSVALSTTLRSVKLGLVNRCSRARPRSGSGLPKLLATAAAVGAGAGAGAGADAIARAELLRMQHSHVVRTPSSPGQAA